MKAILINSELRTITPIDIDGTLQAIYAAIGNGCDIVECHFHIHNDTFYVGKEGRMKQVKGAFQIEGFHSPLVGNAVVSLEIAKEGCEDHYR